MEIINRLNNLLRSMDLPPNRKAQNTPHNLRWLHKNLSARNGNHPNYKEAMQILEELV